MTDKPFCASSPEAQELTDDEFWDHVYPGPPKPDYEDLLLEQFTEESPVGFTIVDSITGEVVRLIRPDSGCSVCGSIEACSYDEEGRPLIHPTIENTE